MDMVSERSGGETAITDMILSSSSKSKREMDWRLLVKILGHRRLLSTQMQLIHRCLGWQGGGSRLTFEDREWKSIAKEYVIQGGVRKAATGRVKRGDLFHNRNQDTTEPAKQPHTINTMKLE